MRVVNPEILDTGTRRVRPTHHASHVALPRLRLGARATCARGPLADALAPPPCTHARTYQPAAAADAADAANDDPAADANYTADVDDNGLLRRRWRQWPSFTW